MGQFNLYKEGLRLDFLRQYCIGNGKLRIMERGATFQQPNVSSRHIAYVEKGCFKYIVHNDTENKNYITGFALENEFVADYPNCLYGTTSKVLIEASEKSKVYIIEGAEVYRMLTKNAEYLLYGMKIMESLFSQVYSSYTDLYRLDARGRYEALLIRCPQIVQQLSLKDIASYLKLHPNTISKIRRDITFAGL